MKHLRGLLVLGVMLLGVLAAQAKGTQPLIVVLNAEGAITPPMAEYIGRGIQVAERDGAEAMLVQLDTPGGDTKSLSTIIQSIRASTVPVIIYVAPNGAMAGSAGALVTMAGHAAAMAPEAVIGASSVVGTGGQELDPTIKAKETEILKASIRPLVEPRGARALQLAQDMVEHAKAVSATEALDAGLIDKIAISQDDLIRQLDGFTVRMADGPRALSTAGAVTEPVEMSLIEQILLVATDPNIVFILLSIGVLALQVELTHPGTWVPGLIGVSCLALAIYGLGVLPVNWFGLVFIITAFVLFVLEIKAPTHGALTVAGVASFVLGALVLFNSPGVPDFGRVSVPLVVGVGAAFGLMFAGIVSFALRAQLFPLQMGAETIVGKPGT
ncbi:MAG TPA: ATP-dependent Clp protease proteolytic subunit, partial [Anaerolineales bacterium]|nr:ATP-dependent Clp protease proteolytic subunit [Anaerolineales bacterium]